MGRRVDSDWHWYASSQIELLWTPIALKLGVVAAASGFQGECRRQVRSLVKKAGGTYSGDLVAGRTSVLVQAPKAEVHHSQKVNKAICWKIPVVTGAWLADSHAAKIKQDFQAYLCHQIATAKPPATGQNRSRPLLSIGNQPRQALQDKTNVLQSCSQRSISFQKAMAADSHRSAAKAEELQQHNQDSDRQDFEPPDIEVSRRAVTTRQDRARTPSLDITSSHEELQPLQGRRHVRMANRIHRPPSPKASSSSSDSLIPGGLSSDDEAPCQISVPEHHLADSGSSLLSREPMQADASACLVSTPTPAGEGESQLLNRRIIRLCLPPGMTPACEVSVMNGDREEPCTSPAIDASLSSAETPIHQAGNALKSLLGTQLSSCSRANTAPQPRISQLPLENVTSRKHHRPAVHDINAVESAMPSFRGRTIVQPSHLKTTSHQAASSSDCQGASSAAQCMPEPSMLSAAASRSAGSSAVAALEAAQAYPIDGKVQLLRMLARPPRGNTVRAFHGLKQIKDVPFAELLQLQV